MNVHPLTKEAYTLFHKGSLALGRAERAGIRVDVEYIKRKVQFVENLMRRNEEKFKQTDFYKHWKHIAGNVDLNSGMQLRHFLYDVKKLEPPKFTDSGLPSVDEDALKQLAIPELNYLIERVRYKKPYDVLNEFLREQVDGFIHPFFNLNTVTTFRSSSDSPNFQNIPARDKEVMNICRQVLYPRPGHQLIEIDFSSIEVKIATCYHKDPTMIAYNKDPHSDMHGDMTTQIFDVKKSLPSFKILRYATKNGFVFPQFYGDYYKNCAKNLACNWGKLPAGKWQKGQGIELDTKEFTLADHLIAKGFNSLESFENHIKKIEDDFWNKRFPEYTAWKERWWKIYNKYGYFDLVTGFRCQGIMNKRQVINYPVQGAAFHCLLWTLITVDEFLQYSEFDSRIVGQIHDSIIIDANINEVDDIVDMVYEIATEQLPKNWPWIIVPLDVEVDVCPIDGSWAEKNKDVEND